MKQSINNGDKRSVGKDKNGMMMMIEHHAAKPRQEKGGRGGEKGARRGRQTTDTDEERNDFESTTSIHRKEKKKKKKGGKPGAQPRADQSPQSRVFPARPAQAPSPSRASGGASGPRSAGWGGVGEEMV